jgi:hypothetical protein
MQGDGWYVSIAIYQNYAEKIPLRPSSASLPKINELLYVRSSIG